VRNPAAEIAPAVDIARLTHEWDALDGREQRTLAEFRVAKGKLLIEARRAFPARGPRAKGWGELLTKWRIAERTARDYMKLAGYVEENEVSASFAEIPRAALELVCPVRLARALLAGLVAFLQLIWFALSYDGSPNYAGSW
jgi:hypothetical protein